MTTLPKGWHAQRLKEGAEASRRLMARKPQQQGHVLRFILGFIAAIAMGVSYWHSIN